jgi:holo-[acyl-carrier protein] synthase
MIIGIGMDLVEVARVGKLLDRHPGRATGRLFTDREIRHCASARAPVESFAARFAAKEALFKALGTGWASGAAWREVEVLPDAAGAPRLELHGVTGELAERRGVVRTHVTLTHTGSMAAAFVVLEGAVTSGERSPAVGLP